MEKIQCCICETTEYSRPYKFVDNYRLLKCRRCGLVYIDTRIDPESFMNDAKLDLNSSNNKKIEYWSFPGMYAKYNFVFLKYFNERFNRCIAFNRNIETMFDIGSGYGFWMDFCRKKGLKVKGIDISDDAVCHSSKVLGLDVIKSPLKKYKFTESFDLYNMCDVIEHLENPNDELALLHEQMKPTSLLYIQVPDVLGIRIPYNHNLGLPHHIWQFNYKTANKLLNKNGFRVLQKWHGVQGVIGCYVNDKVTLLRKLSWVGAEKFNIGNRLMLVCRKT